MSAEGDYNLRTRMAGLFRRYMDASNPYATTPSNVYELVIRPLEIFQRYSPEGMTLGEFIVIAKQAVQDADESGFLVVAAGSDKS